MIKKIFYIILLLYLPFANSVNIKDLNKVQLVMSEDSLKNTSQSKEYETLTQEKKELYPNIYDIYTLKVDNSLPLVIFKNFIDTLRINNDQINLSVEIPDNIKKADLFLLINKMKRDMFYQVSRGVYNFDNVFLDSGENVIEIFYRIGNRKSTSAYSIIIRE